MSYLPEPTRSPAQPSPSRLPTLSRRPTTGAADKDNASRRRNLLPQPGAAKITGPAAPAAKEEHSTAQSGQSAAGQIRPPNRTQSVTSKLAAARKGEDRTRQMMPPPPSSSGTSRAQSLRKPATTTAGLRAPAKPASASAVPKTGAHSQPDASRSSRPVSSTSASTHNPPPPKVGQRERSRAATIASPQAERTRPASISQRIPPPAGGELKRGSTALKHARSRSELTTAAARPPTNAPSSRGIAALDRESKLAAKPAFSTLQQHYSPKKTLEPKKATAAFFSAPPTNSSGAESLSAEALALQTELLQLHLLYESAGAVQAQWERSAERALRIQFYEVATAHHSMRKNEGEVQELVNVAALQEWSSGSAAFGLAENIQLLGPLLNELRALTDSAGRHTRAIQEFEEWMGKVEEVWAGRAATQGLAVAEGLGEGWRAEVGALLRKTALLARDAGRLTEAAAGSSVAAVVDSCRALVQGMVGELQLMRRVELEVGEGEARFVERGLRGIAAGAEGSTGGWRVV